MSTALVLLVDDTVWLLNMLTGHFVCNKISVVSSFVHDRFTSFKVEHLTKTLLVPSTPVLPILHKVSEVSFAFASRLQTISSIYSSIPLSPQRVRLWAQQFLMIMQYTFHAWDESFPLRSTYSSVDIFSLFLIKCSDKLFIPISPRLQSLKSKIFQFCAVETDIKKINDEIWCGCKVIPVSLIVPSPKLAEIACGILSLLASM